MDLRGPIASDPGRSGKHVVTLHAPAQPQMGLAPVQTCPTPRRRRVPRRCQLSFGRLRPAKPVRECLLPPETQNGEQLTRPPPAGGVEEDRACAATEERPSSSEPQRMRD